MAEAYLLKRSLDLKYYFNLRAGNNEIVLTSEMYLSKQNAINGIISVKSNSPYESRYQRKVSTRGKNYFNLTAANNEIIGTSEEYNTVEARENGINVVKKIGPSAPVIDMT
jgi:hypothetical protein